MSPHPRLIIAIDGPAGAGKSTAARGVADRLGYLYIDTGAMYRAVALKALREQLSLDEPTALAAAAEQADIRLETSAAGTRVWLDDQEVTSQIRTPEVTAASSRISAVPGVREEMVRRQRRWGREGGVVMEGRDIGTVVFPEAQVKIFLSASPEERVRRRVAELAAAGTPISPEVVRQQMLERDERDSSRAASPLAPAADAVILNTDHLSADEGVEQIVQICRQRGAAP
jgi:cytidylate kinase